MTVGAELRRSGDYRNAVAEILRSVRSQAGHEGSQVPRSNSNRIHDPNVRQLAALAQPVYGCRTDAELHGYFARLEQPVPAAAEGSEIRDRRRGQARADRTWVVSRRRRRRIISAICEAFTPPAMMP